MSTKKTKTKTSKSKVKTDDKTLTNKKCMEMTVKDIKHHPNYSQITGRSSMNKEELCKALTKVTTSNKKSPPKKKRTPKSEPKPRSSKSESKRTTKSEPKSRSVESPKTPSKFKADSPKKAPKKLPKVPVKNHNLTGSKEVRVFKPISPLKTPKNTDLTVEDIFDLTRSPVKSNKYLRPIPKTAEQSIRIHAQRKIHGAPKANIKIKTPSPLSKSPLRGRASYEDNFVDITIDRDGEETVLYGLPGDAWQSVIDKLPKTWGPGKLIDTTFLEEEEIMPLSPIPKISVTARFEPESSGIFSFLF